MKTDVERCESKDRITIDVHAPHGQFSYSSCLGMAYRAATLLAKERSRRPVGDPSIEPNLTLGKVSYTFDTELDD